MSLSAKYIDVSSLSFSLMERDELEFAYARYVEKSRERYRIRRRIWWRNRLAVVSIVLSLFGVFGVVAFGIVATFGMNSVTELAIGLAACVAVLILANRRRWPAPYALYERWMAEEEAAVNDHETHSEAAGYAAQLLKDWDKTHPPTSTGKELA